MNDEFRKLVLSHFLNFFVLLVNHFSIVTNINEQCLITKT